MIYRCKDLGLITEEHAGRLFKYSSARGWTRGEPDDDGLAIELPRLLERSIRLLLTQGGFTVERLLAELRLAPADIEALTGLPSGLLSKRSNQVALLPTPTLKAATINAERADVVPIRSPPSRPDADSRAGSVTQAQALPLLRQRQPADRRLQAQARQRRAPM